MNIKHFNLVENTHGEFLFVIDIKNIKDIDNAKYGFRINIYNNFDFCDNCIYVPEYFINRKIDYIIKYKICYHAEAIKDKIQWDSVKNKLDKNDLYIIFHLDDHTIAMSDSATKSDVFNQNISYQDLIIKRLIE